MKELSQRPHEHYIRFDGDGYGIIEVKGTITGSTRTVSPKVDRLGNTTMLEFGYALLQKNPTFTFPKARNLKESKVVGTDLVQK